MEYTFRSSNRAKVASSSDSKNQTVTPLQMPSNQDGSLQRVDSCGNPFIDETSPKVEKPKEEDKVEPNVDINGIMQNRNHQKILASPDIAINKDRVKKKNKILERLGGTPNGSPTAKAETTDKQKEDESFTINSAIKNPVEVPQAEKFNRKGKRVEIPNANDEEELLIYNSPKAEIGRAHV